jgi:hypothetical protein
MVLCILYFWNGPPKDCCFRNGPEDHVDLLERMQKSPKVAQKIACFWNGPKHLVFLERSS